MNDRFANAISSWREALGSENVVLEPEQLVSAATATFHTGRQIRAILSPDTRDNVQACLRTSNRHGIPIYPVSAGKNWGYGSAVPTADRCVLLNLSKLNRIVDYDDKLGFVRLEPGVTQAQLYEFLLEKGGNFWMDATGSSPSSSIIGNTLERGYGHSPYADHFAHVCNLEVVLANGEYIQTGFGGLENARAQSVFRWGLGPYIDGLFTQSNLGVVTQMTVWLMPVPDHFQAFYFSVEKNSGLPAVIDSLRPLKLRGVVSSALHIANSYKVLSSIQQYPWEKTDGKTPLPISVLKELGKNWEFGAWNGAGALYGTRGEVAQARKQIKKTLNRKVHKLRFVDDTYLQLAERFQAPIEKLTGMDVSRMLRLVRPVHELMKGKPTEKFVASAYWRKKIPIPQHMNPDRDGCGLIWCSPVSPIDGGDAMALANLASDVLLFHGFEPGMTMTLLSQRCLENVIGIAYDRDIEGEDERAMACYHDLLDRLVKNGFYPYRLGTHSMDRCAAWGSTDRKFLQSLKDALDSNGILAPGRYA